VIKFVSNLRQVGGFLWVLRFPPPIKLTALHMYIAKMLLQVALNTIKPNQPIKQEHVFPPWILMATFPVKAFWNIENIYVILWCHCFICHESGRWYCRWIVFIILRSLWYNHLSFLWFLFNVVFLTTIFPSQLYLSIVQASLLPFWSPPPILVDTIGRDVTRIETYFNDLRWVSYFSRSVINHLY